MPSFLNLISSNFLAKLFSFPFLVISLVFHETAHGYMAYRLGDNTAKNNGRLTLNPLKHLDPVGTLCLLFAPMGWAKPVPVNPYYMRKPKLGMALVALAGPISNIILAFIGTFIWCVIYIYYPESTVAFSAASYFIQLNIVLAIFNLIPFPPLDGSKILFSVLPDRAYYKYMTYEKYGFIILIGLVFFGVFDSFLFTARTAVMQSMLSFVSGIFMALGLV